MSEQASSPNPSPIKKPLARIHYLGVFFMCLAVTTIVSIILGSAGIQYSPGEQSGLFVYALLGRSLGAYTFAFISMYLSRNAKLGYVIAVVSCLGMAVGYMMQKPV